LGLMRLKIPRRRRIVPRIEGMSAVHERMPVATNPIDPIKSRMIPQTMVMIGMRVNVPDSASGASAEIEDPLRILRSRSQVFEFDEANEFRLRIDNELGFFHSLPPYPNRPMLRLTKIEPPNPRRSAA